MSTIDKGTFQWLADLLDNGYTLQEALRTISPNGETRSDRIILNDITLPSTITPGALEYSDGHWYLSNGARHAITTSAGVKLTTTTVTNTVTETTLYSYTFIAGELHADEKISAIISGVVTNASAADDFTIRFKMGGVTIHTVSRVGGNVIDEGWRMTFEGTIRTEGASGTFVDYSSYEEGSLSYQSADVTTHSVDTTADTLFEVTFEWDAAKAGNTISCTQGHLLINH